ncbi:MAG: DUF4332 domain-containing protein [Coriobacteriia bacterium]
MAYYIDAEKLTLDDVGKRIEATDLVPSRAPLLDGIEAAMSALKAYGITTLAQLRSELKTAKRLDATAQATGIGEQYLTLLRREVESYFPKPTVLKAFDWLPESEIAKLERSGIRDSAALYAEANAPKDRAALAESTGVDADVLESFARLVDLTRVQWVSPTTARMLVEATYDSTSKLAAADAEVLCEALEQANRGNRFFKGKIGLRDIKRLIQAARYVAD